MTEASEVFEEDFGFVKDAEEVLSKIAEEEERERRRRSSIGYRSKKQLEEVTRTIRRQSKKNRLTASTSNVNSANGTPTSKEKDAKHNKENSATGITNLSKSSPAPKTTSSQSKVPLAPSNNGTPNPADSPDSPRKRKRPSKSASLSNIGSMIKKPKMINGVLKVMSTTPNGTKKRVMISEGSLLNFIQDPSATKKTGSSTKRTQSSKVFAVSLDTLMNQQRSSFPELDIPVFAKRSIDFLMAHGLSEKGIFRISANKAALDKTQQQIDEGTLLIMHLLTVGKLKDFVYGNDCDCHLVAGLLKLWLRQLPECLFTNHLCDDFVSCIDDENVDLSKLKELVCSLPANNLHLTQKLFALYKSIHDNREQNSMGAENIATTNAPNILNPKPEKADMTFLLKGNRVVQAIVENFDDMFAPSSSESASVPDAVERALFEEEDIDTQTEQTEPDAELDDEEEEYTDFEEASHEHDELLQHQVREAFFSDTNQNESV